MKYEITRDQIIELALRSDKASIWLQQNFKDAFKPVLEVGKWYNYNNSIVNYQGTLNNLLQGYGIRLLNKEWMSLSNMGSFPEKWSEATEQEVFEALKNEAVKRGYKKGTYTEDLFFDPKRDSAVISSDEFDWEIAFCGKQEGKKCLRDSDGNVIFVDGKWAEIIPTITKQEAEELLNKKIV